MSSFDSRNIDTARSGVTAPSVFAASLIASATSSVEESLTR
jgi:hypothetical protein